jgi:hypothetical protein
LVGLDSKTLRHGDEVVSSVSECSDRERKDLLTEDESSVITSQMNEKNRYERATLVCFVV